MKAVVLNWKTTLAGVALLVVSGLHTFAGVAVPAIDFGQAVPIALGLILASDATAFTKEKAQP